MEEALKSGTRRIMQTIHKRLVSNGDLLAGGGGGGSLPTSLHPQLSCQKPGNWTRLLPGKRDTIREPEVGASWPSRAPQSDTSPSPAFSSLEPRLPPTSSSPCSASHCHRTPSTASCSHLAQAGAQDLPSSSPGSPGSSGHLVLGQPVLQPPLISSAISAPLSGVGGLTDNRGSCRMDRKAVRALSALGDQGEAGRPFSG